MQRKDTKIKLSKKPKYYMNRIYSSAPNCWFHDLLDNGAGNEPRYWHVFVGVNTRYLDAYPMKGKADRDVRQSLTWFINKYHPEKLTSDDESAFTSKMTCDLCTNNDVKLAIVQDKNHSSLGVVDRVIRTLRDMNIPKRYSEQSSDKQFHTFSIEKMNRLKDEYNNKYNSSIQCSPNEMNQDVKKEIEFITRLQKHRNAQHHIKDYKLIVGTYVRFRVDKLPLTKHRFTFESYKVSGKEGYTFSRLLMALRSQNLDSNSSKQTSMCILGHIHSETTKESLKRFLITMNVGIHTKSSMRTAMTRFLHRIFADVSRRGCLRWKKNSSRQDAKLFGVSHLKLFQSVLYHAYTVMYGGMKSAPEPVLPVLPLTLCV